MNLQEVRESALALPRRSREKLLNDLRDSLEENTCPPGVLSDRDPNFMKIIVARLDAYERGEDKGTPWEEVQAKMEARIHARKTSRRRKI
jgi:putative addiction module component (TIGR02574 family)